MIGQRKLFTKTIPLIKQTEGGILWFLLYIQQTGTKNPLVINQPLQTHNHHQLINSLNKFKHKSQMKKQMTLIYYYVPEDKDDPQVPNVFGVNIKKDQIRLKHLHENFPIAGQYIFRFKVLYENNIAWLDLPDANAKLPTFKDKIMVKASRVSWQSKRLQPSQQQSTKISHSQSVNEHKFSSVDTRPQLKVQKSPVRSEQKKGTESFNLIDDMHLHQNNNTKSGGQQDDSLL